MVSLSCAAHSVAPLLDVSDLDVLVRPTMLLLYTSCHLALTVSPSRIVFLFSLQKVSSCVRLHGDRVWVLHVVSFIKVFF